MAHQPGTPTGERSLRGDTALPDTTTHDKRRGGYYTPVRLVELCWNRIGALSTGHSLRVLEPSAGDGAFIRGLNGSPLKDRVSRVDAIEISEPEAHKCSATLRDTNTDGRVINASAISWATRTNERYDIVVGNPPFVGYHHITPADRADATRLGTLMGITFSGVSNLWLLVALSALGRLRSGGTFAFVAPSESLGGISPAVLRRWLLGHTTDLRIDTFGPGSFPGVLQEVVVVSGRRETAKPGAAACCTVTDHARGGTTTLHTVSPAATTWTRYLLSAPQLAAFEYASSLDDITPLSEHASFSVSAVTGANSFFAVNDKTATQRRLTEWSRPLLARIQHAPGLVYTPTDHDAAVDSDSPTHLLDFSAERADPRDSEAASRYLAVGEQEGIPRRYKCRTRRPWFRVRIVAPGALMLPKRSHHYHRVVVNETDAVTVDTIYRGSLTERSPCTARDIAASFHNSLTLLSAEITGRTYGGGVLELVPSEAAALRLPAIPGLGSELRRLDDIARDHATPQQLVDATDELLTSRIGGLDMDTIRTLREARRFLTQRRLNRNQHSTTTTRRRT